MGSFFYIAFIVDSLIMLFNLSRRTVLAIGAAECMQPAHTVSPAFDQILWRIPFSLQATLKN